jgi:predicted ester cyclase
MLLGYPGTGKIIEAGAIFIYRFAGGKIAEIWAGLMTLPV